MGASGKWIKSLVGLKAPSSAGTKGTKGRKWSRLWRSPSSSSSSASRGGGNSAPSPWCETSSASSAAAAGALSSDVVAAVLRAPPKDFWVIRQEWAAVRVQTAFRAFLARRALKALRGIVRLQALVRGRLVRRQLAVTLNRMEALLRVQERAMERRARCSADGGDDPVREAEEQCCARQGSVDEVRSKMQMKHEGAVKRERATAYSLSHQSRSVKHRGRPSSPASSLRNHESYIEGWMATKPWDSRRMDPNRSESHCLENSNELNLAGPKFSDGGRSVKVRRNNVATMVEAKSASLLSASSASLDLAFDESSPSTSWVTPASAAMASEARSVDSVHRGGGPGYMSLTKSARARLDGCGGSRSRRGQSPQMQRQRSGGMPYRRRVALSSLDSQSNAGSDISAACRRLNSMSLKGQGMMTRSLDKENDY